MWIHVCIRSRVGYLPTHDLPLPLLTCSPTYPPLQCFNKRGAFTTTRSLAIYSTYRSSSGRKIGGWLGCGRLCGGWNLFCLAGLSKPIQIEHPFRLGEAGPGGADGLGGAWWCVSCLTVRQLSDGLRVRVGRWSDVGCPCQRWAFWEGKSPCVLGGETKKRYSVILVII